ncbi:MAG: TonB-dependent receptor [Bordetella sp.]|nr:TonB-dependent receptor [Bordetella sp.]
MRAILMGTAAAGAVLTGHAAHAQQAAPPASEAVEVEAIVVTGTAIRGVAPVGSATVGMTREDLVQAPAKDASALVASLPQASSQGTTLASSGGRAAGVNLRGLGNNATLVLFDSRRVVPQGGNAQVSDPNLIPFSAIERVEVVTDGASAIYGSDAVAGVVNYITRRNYDGAEITGRWVNSLYNQYVVDGVIGRTWEGGGVMFAGSWDKNDSVPRSARDYMMQDLRPFGGNDNRLVGTTVYPGAPGALIIGNTVYGLPQTNGAVPNAADVLALQGKPELYDSSYLYDFYTARERHAAMFKLRQEVAPGFELGYTGIYNLRENSSRAGDGFERVSIRLTPGSPYYIPGMPNPTANQTLVYNLSLNNPDVSRSQDNREETINHSVDMTLDLPRDYRFSGLLTYGKTDSCNVCQAQVNTTVGNVIASNASWGFNPYLLGSQAGADPLVGGFIQQYDTVLFDAVAKIDGPLFSLPAGEARLAAGTEFSRHKLYLKAQNTLNLAGEYQTSRFTKSDREVKSAFAEVFVPLVSEAQGVPLMQSLDLSAAVRYDSYSDAGDTTNPKVGVTWRPNEEFLVRASWGTSFRAPTLIEANPATVGQTNRVYVSNGLNDPNIPVTNPASGQSAVLSRTGNTAGLRPESATIWSLGGEYRPNYLPDLKLSLTYYNVNYEDRIENLPNQTLILSSPENLALYKDFFIAAPQPTSCVNGDYSTYNLAYLPWLTDPNAVYSPSTINDCSMVGVIAGGRLNLGQVKQSGLDFGANYRHETAFGDFGFNASFSKVLNLEKSVVAGGPLFDALDTYGFQVSERGRFNVNYRRDGLTANVTANYVGSYLNNATITVGGVKLPDTEIPAWTTWDAGLAYDFDDGGVLDGVRVAVNVQNFTDEQPPIVLSGTTAVDLGNHNPFGRVWSVELTKRF